jgi:hypothetical protein
MENRAGVRRNASTALVYSDRHPALLRLYEGWPAAHGLHARVAA